MDQSVPPRLAPPTAWLPPLQRLSAWRARRRASPGWTITVALILAAVLLPILSILVLAFTAGGDIWPHLAANVLPGSLIVTIALLAGVGLITLVIGTGLAWLVTMYRFPGRDAAAWLVLIPLAMPTYIVAFSYADLLDYGGPVQSAVRAAGGWTSARDYWFPQIRSLWGAVFVLSFVLYPYVYLSARASFLQQSACALEVARTLGRSTHQTFWEVGLPLARPALAAGLALALMECLNDIGAVQHLGVRTLTVSVYDTWLQRSSLSGAAQIAGIMLICVLALLLFERAARGNSLYHQSTNRYRPMPFGKLGGLKGRLALFLCLLPVLVGFAIPVAALAQAAWQNAAAGSAELARAAWHSVMLAGAAALVTLIAGLLLAYARRVAPNGFTLPAIRLAGLGYAIPGTVMAVGLIIPLAALDNRIDAFLRSMFGVSSGLLLTGSIAALVLAYTIRFLTVSLGALEEGLGRVSPNLDAASRALGQSAFSTLRIVHVPLLRPAIGAAALMVFVDSMKELPATLLLRPFNFETLATYVYSNVALERFDEAGLAALVIVAVGLLPVLLLHATMSGGRVGGAMPEE